LFTYWNPYNTTNHVSDYGADKSTINDTIVSAYTTTIEPSFFATEFMSHFSTIIQADKSANTFSNCTT
jgi:hypothetical protein